MKRERLTDYAYWHLSALGVVIVAIGAMGAIECGQPVAECVSVLAAYCGLMITCCVLRRLTS